MKTSIILVATLLAMLPGSGAHAGTISNWVASDGATAVPLAKGVSLIDARISSIHFLTAAHALSLNAPILNVAGGIAEGLECGVGTTVSSRALFDPTNTTDYEIHPWVKLALPGSDTVKTGLVAGAYGVFSSASSLDWLPGFSGLVDITSGPLTTNLQLGLTRQLREGADSAAVSVALTMPTGPFSVHEEQFYTYFMGKSVSFSTAGTRLKLAYPLSDTISAHLGIAAFWSNSGGVPNWFFSPTLGSALEF